MYRIHFSLHRVYTAFLQLKVGRQSIPLAQEVSQLEILEKRELGTWVILHKAFVEVSQLIGRDVTVRVIGRLEVQIILPIPVELRCRHIHADDNLICVARLADGVLDELQGCGTQTLYNE